jgi:non-specific protein-tyrosine kinase
MLGVLVARREGGGGATHVYKGAMTESEDRVDVREYFRVLRNRKWSITLVVALVVGAALVLSFSQSPMYRSEARVLVVPAGSATIFTPTVDMGTETEIATSDPVAEKVGEELEIQPAGSLLGGLEVAQVGDTRVLAFTYSAADPALAQRTAEAFANSYIAYRAEERLRQLASEQNAAQEQIDQTSQQLSDVTARLKKAESDQNESLTETLSRERDALVARLGVLQQRLADVSASPSGSGTTSQVIEGARLPSSPYSPNHVRNGLLALFLGLALGVGLAFLRERLEDRIRDRDDIERALGAPVLATTPRYTIPKGQKFTPITLFQPIGGASEVYRSLRTSLQFVAGQSGMKSIVVTSATVGEGKTSTSVNLGIVLAQAGQRVVLISADLRRPSLERYFGLGTTGHGLSTWLASGDAEPWGILADPGIKNLRVIPSGPVPPNPAELLGSARMRHLISLLEENSDFVVIDSPPVLAVSDAAVMGRHAGASVLVIDGSTHRSAAVRAKEEVERTGGVLIGAVLNGIDATTSSYYYYSSNYSSHKQEPVSEVKEKKRSRRKRERARSKASS